MKRAGAQDLLPHHALVTPLLVEKVAGDGGRVMPWTVNVPREAGRLVATGVHGVITDDEEALLTTLRTELGPFGASLNAHVATVLHDMMK